MSSRLKKLGIDQLSVDERLALVEEIWNELASNPHQVPLTDAQREELDRRLEEHEANPEDVVAWETVRDEALARLRQ